MNEWILFGVLVTLGLFGLGIALVPLRHSKQLVLILGPVLVLVFMFAYRSWGGWSAWRTFQVAQIKQQQAEALVHSLGSTKAIIERFQAYLKHDPKDAKAWFLLGRVYVAEADWPHANTAFATAHRLKPNDEEFTLHYVQSEWELHHQTFNEASRTLLLKILDKDAEQPDALAMLAFDAYARHDDQLAVMYWERLLRLAPQGSEEANKLRQAIAKARMRMK